MAIKMTNRQVRRVLIVLYAGAALVFILTGNIRSLLLIGIPMFIVTYIGAGIGLKAYEERQRDAEDGSQQ
jgi:hypothetical protein